MRVGCPKSAKSFGLMLGIELGKLGKRSQPTPSQILVAHLSRVAKAVQRTARVAFRILL